MNHRYPKLRWGISTLGCPQLNLPQAVELADQYGIEFFEIRTLNNKIEANETLYYPENESVMRQISAAGRCRVLDSSFGLTCNDETKRQELLQIARTADDFNIPYVRIFGGGKYGDELTREHLECAKDTLEWFNRQKFTTRLALETHDICVSADNCLAVADFAGVELPIIWDAHHTRQLANEEFADTFSKLARHIVSVHFKDSHYVYDQDQRYCKLDLLGEGVVPLDELFALLEANDVQVPVTLEHEKFWRKHLPELPVMLETWQKLFCI